MSSAIGGLLLASGLCLTLPTMARAQNPPTPVAAAAPTVLPDVIWRAVLGRMVALQRTDGTEPTARIVSFTSALLVVSVHPNASTLTVPRASVTAVRLPSAVPMIDRDRMAPDAPRRQRHVELNLSIAPGFDLDLDAGCFHGFANLGIVLPMGTMAASFRSRSNWGREFRYRATARCGWKESAMPPRTSLSHCLSILSQVVPQDAATLVKDVPQEQILQALHATGSASIRHRKLPAGQMVWLVIGLARESGLFGGTKTPRGSSGYPLCRLVALMALRSHLLAATAFGPYETGELGSDPNLLYNRARVLHKAGRFAEAVTNYQKFLDAHAGGTDDQHRKAEQYLEQARTNAAIQHTSNEQPRTPPLYKRWWLWTAVGVVVAGVAVGVGLGIAARQPDTTGAFTLDIPK